MMNKKIILLSAFALTASSYVLPALFQKPDVLSCEGADALAALARESGEMLYADEIEQAEYAFLRAEKAHALLESNIAEAQKIIADMNSPILLEAVERGDFESVVELLKNGADAQCVDTHSSITNRTPLYIAIQKGYAAIASLLLKHHGANPHLVSGCCINGSLVFNGMTLLHTAAGASYDECVKLLLDSGVAVNARDKEGMYQGGWTALDYACDQVNESIKANSRERFDRAKRCIHLIQARGGKANYFNVEESKHKRFSCEALVSSSSMEQSASAVQCVQQ